MDWSSIERAIERQSYSSSRQEIISGKGGEGRSSTSLLPLGPSSHLNQPTSKADARDRISSSGQNLFPLTFSHGEKSSLTQPLPPQAQVQTQSANGTTTFVPSTTPFSASATTSSTSISSSVLTTILDEMANMKRILNSQSHQIDSLSSQQEQSIQQASHYYTQLDDLHEHYPLLLADVKKLSSQLTMVNQDYETIQMKMKKQEFRLTNCEEQQRYYQQSFVQKDSLKQLLDSLLDDSKENKKVNQMLQQRLEEVSGFVENLVNALLILPQAAGATGSSSGNSGNSGNNSQLSFLGIENSKRDGENTVLQINILQSMTSSNLYKENIKKLITEGLLEGIQSISQKQNRLFQESLQSSLLSCIKDMREHNEYLLQPFLESQGQLTAKVNKYSEEFEGIRELLGGGSSGNRVTLSSSLLNQSTATANVRNDIETLTERLMMIEKKVQDSIDNLSESSRNDHSSMMISIHEIEKKYDKQLLTLETTLELTKNKTEVIQDSMKVVTTTYSTLESSLDNTKKEIKLLQQDLNADVFFHSNKLIKDLQVQMNNIVSEYYTFKSSMESNLTSSLQTLQKEVYQQMSDQTKKYGLFISSIDEEQKKKEEIIQSLRDQMNHLSQSFLPISTNYESVNADVKKISSDITSLSEDLMTKYDRVLKERLENKNYWEERERNMNQVMLEKYQRIENDAQKWNQSVEKLILEIKQDQSNLDLLHRMEKVEENVHKISVNLTDYKENYLSNNHKIDNVDIHLRKEMDKLKQEVFKSLHDNQEKSHVQSKGIDKRLSEVEEQLRQGLNKSNQQIDQCLNDLRKCQIQAIEIESSMDKYSTKVSQYQNLLEDMEEKVTIKFDDRVKETETLIKSHQADILHQLQANESLYKKEIENLQDKMSTLTQEEKKHMEDLETKLSEELKVNKDVISLHIDQEVTKLDEDWQSKQEKGQKEMNESLETILSQHLQLSNILNTMEAAQNKIQDDVNKNKDLLTLEILSMKEKSNGQFNQLFKTFNNEMEELKYEIQQLRNKSQLLELCINQMSSSSNSTKSSVVPPLPPSSQTNAMMNNSISNNNKSIPDTILSGKVEQLEIQLQGLLKHFPEQCEDIIGKYLTDHQLSPSSTGSSASDIQVLTTNLQNFHNQLTKLESEVSQITIKITSNIILQDPVSFESKLESKVQDQLLDEWKKQCNDLVACCVKCDDYNLVVERIQKTTASIQSQVDLLQEELVELGQQQQLSQHVQQPAMTTPVKASSPAIEKKKALDSPQVGKSRNPSINKGILPALPPEPSNIHTTNTSNKVLSSKSPIISKEIAITSSATPSSIKATQQDIVKENISSQPSLHDSREGSAKEAPSTPLTVKTSAGNDGGGAHLKAIQSPLSPNSFDESSDLLGDSFEESQEAVNHQQTASYNSIPAAPPVPSSFPTFARAGPGTPYQQHLDQVFKNLHELSVEESHEDGQGESNGNKANSMEEDDEDSRIEEDYELIRDYQANLSHPYYQHSNQDEEKESAEKVKDPVKDEESESDEDDVLKVEEDNKLEISANSFDEDSYEVSKGHDEEDDDEEDEDEDKERNEPASLGSPNRFPRSGNSSSFLQGPTLAHIPPTVLTNTSVKLGVSTSLLSRPPATLSSSSSLAMGRSPLPSPPAYPPPSSSFSTTLPPASSTSSTTAPAPPVLSGSLLTRSRLGIPPPSQTSFSFNS